MDLGLSGRRALVTASTGGIGLRIAAALAREGAEVVVNGRSADRVAAAVERLTADGGAATGLVADAGTADGCATIIEQQPDVDILVNNLGIYTPIPIDESTDEQWLELFGINVLSGVRLTRHYIGGMLSRNTGRVVFISSEAALTPAPELPHYSATKTMELSISRNFAELTKGTGVTVNAVLPGSTRTEGVQEFVQNLFPELPYEQAEARFMAQNRSTSLLARLIDPDEIADVVTFVCSARSGAINGSSLRADGGIVRTVF
ncbi:SDR family NAD(P)-dependent oxidoreductase [Nakamurella multipartita]|jgi:3-oxoacyl-[acyl-carrier protein] reductase|uniref:Short-chain dehydrogenase/reductase SDR n=1 Tax=Nakamurella multipartita (strain ATCC 700099 / DSM 44233 / CIP 104796 / JCM 9543 / NBRC 105858 / Y-104) TaxID=479431 RepID=C8XF47_NAKMY|nr:SDR family oxidoreductase [Nakamurella multipartita]ACV77933.1 short-chain dehydrogenase/reductase SDR [Nakamurella multipartita DSM 44233]